MIYNVEKGPLSNLYIRENKKVATAECKVFTNTSLSKDEQS